LGGSQTFSTSERTGECGEGAADFGVDLGFGDEVGNLAEGQGGAAGEGVVLASSARFVDADLAEAGAEGFQHEVGTCSESSRGVWRTG
jgi:hypothetical protein